MGKQKTQTCLHQKHVLARVNFMYQASVLMAGQHNTLSAYYGELCKRIGQRANQRISPSIKRNMCRRCSLSLQPGITADLTTDTIDNVDLNIPPADKDAVKKLRNSRKRRRHLRNKKQTELKTVLNQPNGTVSEHATTNGLHPQLERKGSSSEHAADTKSVLNQSVEAANKHSIKNGLPPLTKDLSSEQATLPTVSSTATHVPTTIDEHTHMLVKCILCGQKRSFRVNSNYHLWLDDPDSVKSETILKPKS